MTQQPDLFTIPDLGLTKVFPQFKIEHPESVTYRQPDHREMKEILTRLGFGVGELYYRVAEVYPPFPSTVTHEETHIFSVEYPSGWIVTPNLRSVLYQDDLDPIHYLLDQQGKFRGMIFCDQDDIPLRARLFTRYTILVGGHFDPLKVEDLDWKGVKTVVVDRSMVDPEKSQVLPKVAVVHVDTRDLLSERSGAIKEQIRNMSVREGLEFKNRFVQHGESGSSLWLEANFPDWLDPAAYWDQD